MNHLKIFGRIFDKYLISEYCTLSTVSDTLRFLRAASRQGPILDDDNLRREVLLLSHGVLTDEFAGVAQ